MNLTELSLALTKVYNRFGNEYITDNFICEPFKFEVTVKYVDSYQYDYIAYVHSIPKVPKTFEYKPEIKKDMRADITVIEHEFRQFIRYIDPNRAKLTGVIFVNKKV
jgi:hypothetical protein